MDLLKRRNPPITPKTEKFNAEILLSPYGEGLLSGVSGVAANG